MKIGFRKNNTQMRILDAWMMIISFCRAMSYSFKSDILVKSLCTFFLVLYAVQYALK